MLKSRSGFTLVELVVVIAILAILAFIIIPNYVSATERARGSLISANLYACETAVNIYYTSTGCFPESSEVLVGTHLASWPVPPSGNALIKKNDGSDLRLIVSASSYVYNKPSDSEELNKRVGRITLGGKTIEELLSSSESILILTD